MNLFSSRLIAQASRIDSLVTQIRCFVTMSEDDIMAMCRHEDNPYSKMSELERILERAQNGELDDQETTEETHQGT